MKPTKRRIDIRLKKSLFQRITAIADSLEKTWTDVIEEALAYGLKWYEAKIKRESSQQKNTEKTQGQDNNKAEDEEIPPSDEEIKQMLDDLYGKTSTPDCQERR